MSRGVKDLRELVVVSRLTYRDSDSESDDGRAGMITPFESLDLSDGASKLESSNQHRSRSADGQTPTPPSSADSGLGRRKKKRKKPRGYNAVNQVQGAMHNAISPVTELHPFPKAKPLPAVGESSQFMNGLGPRTESSSSGDSLLSASTETIRTDFSDIIEFIDEATVADWLERSNQNLKDLTTWCTDSNFVGFAQFWITEFGMERRSEIVGLEVSILLDEMTLAFRSGQEKGKVRTKDIMDLLTALLREYPKKLTGSASVYLFLDYLDIFTSERALEYRNILSDVKLSTKDKNHVQLILATRSFMLINVWVAVIDFYKQVSDSTPVTSTEHLTKHRDKAEVNYNRLVDAVNNGYTEVVHYFLYSGKISAGHVDSRQKTLLHIATAANQLKVVQYLLKKWTGCMDVNMPCDTGNSPLHVAVNLGNYNLVRVLLNMPDIEVNKENSQCDNATPLHLAVLHGNIDVVRMLFQARADPYKLIGGQTIIDLARDFGHDEIVELLVGSKD